MRLLPQEATNLVGQFVKIIHKVLFNHISNQTKVFLDNIEIKGPKIIFNNKELAPKI